MSAPLTHTNVLCPLCGADDTQRVCDLRLPPGRLLYAPDQTNAISGVERVVACRRCGLVYSNPQPQIAPPWRTYSDAQEQAYFRTTRAARETGANALLRLLERRLGRPGRLLDIGCGDGALLQVALTRGWQAVGVEPSPSLIRNLQGGPLAERVLMAQGEALPVELGPRDAVVLLNVLEHVVTPGAMLDSIRRVLRPGGLLAVHVPNYDWGRWLGKAWRQWQPLDHLLHLTPATLTRLLQQHGFVPVERFSLPLTRGLRAALQRSLNALGIWPGSGLGLIAECAPAADED